MNAAFALDGLDENRAGGGRDGFAHGIEIAVGHMPKTLNRGRETILHLLLAGGRDAREGAAMEGAESGEDFELTFLMATQPREFVERLVGFRAAVAEKHFAAAAGVRHQFLGEQSLRLSVIQIGNMRELAGLLGEGGG